MRYKTLVARHATPLKKAGVLKTVSDIAALLDNPLFGYPKGKKVERCALQSAANIRETMYHALCVHITDAGVTLPPLEPQFYLSKINGEIKEEYVKEVERIKSHVIGQIGDSDEACKDLVAVLEMFPGCCGWDSIKKSMLVAKLNSLLVPAGFFPVRPDYSKIEKVSAQTLKPPVPVVRIAIFDAEIASIAKTALAMAGWERVEIVPLHYRRL